MNNVNPILFHYNLDENGNPKSIDINGEQNQISPIHYSVQLKQRPDEEYNLVVIDDLNNTLSQVEDMEDITENTYYVDYHNALVYFHPSKAGKTFIFNYSGVGFEMIGASRVWDEHDVNGQTVVKTLQEIIDRGRECIDALNIIGNAVELLKRIENYIIVATELDKALKEDIKVGNQLHIDLTNDISTGSTLHKNLTNDISTGTTLDTNLKASITEGNTTKSELDKSRLEAQNDIATIKATGNRTWTIPSSAWVGTEPNLTCVINHKMNSKNLIVGVVDTVTQKSVMNDYEIVDMNNIKMLSMEASNITVTINSQYYSGKDANIIAQEVIDARGVEVDLKSRLDKNDVSLSDIWDELRDGVYILRPSNNGSDSLNLQALINSGVRKIKLCGGNFTFNSKITLKSNIEIEMELGSSCSSSADVLFEIEKASQFITLLNLECVNTNTNNLYALNCIGDTTDLSTITTAIRNVVVRNCRFINFATGIRMSRLRQSVFENVSLYCKNGIEYTHKSAEVNIINSLIIHDSDIHSDSYGIKCVADGLNYPEGLTVTNTLIYEFETNIDIRDLYVGNFVACHVDGKASHCLPNKLYYKVKTDTISFTDCWFFTRGFEIGDGTNSVPARFKSLFNNCKFDHQQSNVITCNRFVHDVFISNCTMYGDGTGGEKIGVVGTTNNNYIKFIDSDVFLLTKVFVLNGVGENNTFERINHDIVSDPAFSNYPINSDMLFVSYNDDIERKANITGATVFTKKYKLGKGMYMIIAQLNDVTVQEKGYLKFTNSNNTSLKGATFFTIDPTDKHITMSSFIDVPSACSTDINIVVESGSISTGYVSKISLCKV